MSKSDFEQAFSNESVELERNNKHPSVNESPTTAFDKKKLVKYYLIVKAAFGITSNKAMSIFKTIVNVYPKDKVLQKTYYKGVEDEKKRRPFKFFNTPKEKSAYESGRQSEKYK